MKQKQYTTYCAHCGRPLKSPGVMVYPIGLLGPECASKFAALPRVLAGLELGELEFGTQTVALEGNEEDGYSLPHAYQLLGKRVEPAGLYLRVRVRPGTLGPVADLSLEVRRAQKLVNACGSYAEFAQGIRRRAMEGSYAS